MSGNELPDYVELLRQEIDPIDLLILRELLEGTPESNIPDKIKEETGVAISRATIRQRIANMENKKIILKKNTVIVDPSKLYTHIYLAFIKTNLLSPIAPAGIKSWRDAFEEIKRINNEYGNPIRILFNIGGTGEYDFVAFIYMNDPNKYHDFKEALVKRTGIIEKYDTKYVDTPELFFFDPISVPDYKEYEKWLRRSNVVIEKMLRKK
jgi:DNA-binding Lrp family transcriptional regulator